MFKKPKKLKKIPSDLVSYIMIETEAMKDFNDKQIISSYCLHKLEVVNWYLDLLEAGSEKYIVPQSKAHLEMVRDQLVECHKRIMNTKIKSPNKRPIIDIDYPEGYEGTPVFLPEEVHGQRNQAGYSPWGHKELDKTE